MRASATPTLHAPLAYLRYKRILRNSRVVAEADIEDRALVGRVLPPLDPSSLNDVWIAVDSTSVYVAYMLPGLEAAIDTVPIDGGPVRRLALTGAQI